MSSSLSFPMKRSGDVSICSLDMMPVIWYSLMGDGEGLVTRDLSGVLNAGAVKY